MNIFVAKLSPSTDEDGLRDIFSAYGDIESAKVIMDRDTGRSKCFGFVEMNDDDSARKAIESLDQTEQNGSTIVVKEAEPRKERGGNNYGNDRSRGGGRDSRGGSGFNTNRW